MPVFPTSYRPPILPNGHIIFCSIGGLSPPSVVIHQLTGEGARRCLPGTSSRRGRVAFKQDETPGTAGALVFDPGAPKATRSLVVEIVTRADHARGLWSNSGAGSSNA
jgi:hypothetical protein